MSNELLYYAALVVGGAISIYVLILAISSIVKDKKRRESALDFFETVPYLAPFALSFLYLLRRDPQAVDEYYNWICASFGAALAFHVVAYSFEKRRSPLEGMFIGFAFLAINVAPETIGHVNGQIVVYDPTSQVVVRMALSAMLIAYTQIELWVENTHAAAKATVRATREMAVLRLDATKTRFTGTFAAVSSDGDKKPTDGSKKPEKDGKQGFFARFRGKKDEKAAPSVPSRTSERGHDQRRQANDDSGRERSGIERQAAPNTN